MSVTTIEWTQRPGTIGETWNPTTGCNKVDRGCKHCYAETMHKRLRAMGQAKYAAPFLDGAVGHEDTLMIPMGWTKPRTVFVNSMSDLFHEKLPFEFVTQVFQTIQLTPQHTYLILTKRPERAYDFYYWMMSQEPGFNFPGNCWIGTSANDQKSAEVRVPILLGIPYINRFLSYEPATGPLDLTKLITSDSAVEEEGRERVLHMVDALNGLEADMAYHRTDQLWRGNIERDKPRLHWVIMGGESGPKGVPMHPAWARVVRDQCRKYGVPFFFKQFGTWAPVTYLDGSGHPTLRFSHEKNIFTFTEPGQNMIKVGKHNSGHELDGQVLQQFPDF
jgi:protein gp37